MPAFSTLPPIILASASPRRKKILENAGYHFEVVTSNVEETTRKTAFETVTANALLKCKAVAQKFPEHLIIAADTVVSLDNKILEKPRNLTEAKSMLKSLSGREHQVITAVSLKYKDEELNFSETSQVFFRALDAKCIDEYLSKVNPLDKAGAYNIDDYGEEIIETIEGEYENIMGLPMKLLQKKIKKINFF